MQEQKSRRLDLRGQRYGELEVIQEAGRTKAHKVTWLCRCDCGKEIVAVGSSLRSGHTTTCGCSYWKYPRNFKHGHSHKDGKRQFTKAYIVWAKMKSRCDNPNDAAYPNYGGRGIAYDSRWKDFENFLADMGEPPDGKFIDRKNNNKGYSKRNCRWATRTENNRNQRSNIRITFEGKTMILSEWAEHLGLKYKTLYNRIVDRKWTLEKALTSNHYDGHGRLLDGSANGFATLA